VNFRPSKEAKEVKVPDKFKGTVISNEYAPAMMHPPTGHRAEKQSFELQNQRFDPVQHRVSQANISRVAKLYPRTSVPCSVESIGTDHEDGAFDHDFFRAFSEMDPKKSPGAIWELGNNTNQLMADNMYHELKEETRALLKMMATEDLTTLTTAELFMKTGIVYKVFVKGELHTVDKIKEGRQRLVYSSPIQMTLLERIIFGPQNAAEIEEAHASSTIPSRPGTPFTPVGAFLLKEQLKQFGRRIVSTDQSGWDWHVQDWLMEADVEARFQLLDGSERGRVLWRRIALNLNELVSRKTIMFSDGVVLCQTRPGIWPSGSYRTSGTNSRMRLILRLEATGDTDAITMGDDAVEGWLERLAVRYEKLGFKLKEPDHAHYNDFEFCSKRFRDGLVIPVDTSVRKMILNLVLHPTQEAKDSILMELSNHHMLDEFKRLGVFDLDEVVDDQQQGEW